MSPSDALGLLANDLLSVSFGSVLIAAGLAALLLPTIHRPARNLSLTSFGAAVLLYGLRELAGLSSFQAITPVSTVIWSYVGTICTYLIPVVTFVFTDQFWGAGRYSSIRRVWQIHLGYAAIAIAVDIVTQTPGAGLGPNSPLVVLWMGVVLGNIIVGALRIDRDFRIVRIGLVVLVVLVANDNLVSLGLLPWQTLLEPLGVVVFTSSLGYALALRTFGNERRLATLDYELRTARQIQQSLLPRELPRAVGESLAVRYIPMAAVGGDLYDCLQVDDRHVGILVADVTGHGIPAAIIASMVKTAAAAQIRVADQPAEVLAGINQHLCGQVDGHYVTAVYVYLDLDTGRVLQANAGHPPPLLLSRADQEVDTIGEGGLILGFVPNATYTTTELPLSPGDRVVLYTDGVVEASAPNGDFFETERLRDTLQSRSELTAERWADHLLEQLTQWCGRASLELDDDLTVLVLDIPGPQSASTTEAG